MDTFLFLLIVVICHLLIISIACAYAFNLMLGIFIFTIPSAILIFLYGKYKVTVEEFQKPSLPFKVEKLNK